MTGPHDDEPLDLPPPYTPSDTGGSEHSNLSTSSATAPPPQQQQQQPPGYHTIHDQSGYLGESSSSSSSNNFTTTTTTKDGPFVEKRGSTSSNSLFKNISYNPSLGPIGNILDIAGNFVSNAANVANVALGAPPPPSNNPADTGNHIARSASIMANNASRAALELVEGFVNSRMERREQKQERREVKRDMKQERREMKRQGKQRQSYDSSSSNSASSSTAAYPFVPRGKVPYQPYSPDSSYSGTSRDRASDYDANTTATTNTNAQLEIKRSNAPLDWNESWSGQSCRLKTTNGHLTIRGSLTATDFIDLETSNGNVTVEGAILATKDISVKSSNGVFILQGQSMIGKHVDVSISNSPLQISSIIQGKTISLKTKNAPINLGHISVGSELNVKTSNSPIELHILDIASNSAKIKVESSNAPVHVFVPSTFSGYFCVSGGSANISAKSVTDSSLINYETNNENKKEGYVKNMGNKSSLEIHIKTTNAPATLYI